MERDLDVRTAEAVAVHFELAGLGSRFLAVVADIAVQLLVVFAVFLVLGTYGALFVHAAPKTLPEDEKVARAIVIALGSIGAFVLFFGYFIVFELLWNGQSPGKRLVGLRVVRDGGFPVDAGSSVIRNVVRIVEMSLGFYVISGLVTLASPENKRLGDIAAGTIVVRDNASAIPTLAALGEEERLPDDGLDRADWSLIKRYLARRSGLDPDASRTIEAAIGARIRPKLRARFDHLNDASLIEHLMRARA